MKRKSSTPYLTLYQPQQPRYPNAADNRYFARKALDILTALVSGLGFVSAMLFLFTMC